MTLTQQLEDKKKGCGCSLRIVDLGQGKEIFICNSKELCKTCKSNIAILEQAIAEIKKRDEEIDNAIDFLSSYPIWTNIINKETGKKEEIPEELYPILDNFLVMIKKVLKEQLQSHIYRGNSSKEKDNQRVPISESATDELNNESKAHSQLSLQKQRQEILNKIDNYNQNKLRWLWNDGEIFIALSSIKQQLNQPKTEE